jgi:hypothetical protein
MTTASIEAKCATCGVTVAITRIQSNERSFEMKPGLTLDDLCPIIIERKKSGNPATEPEECPNLEKAISARIELFRKEHP